MSDRLRIALLTYATKPRGSVVHTLELAEALHRLGHEVCIYALDKQAPDQPEAQGKPQGFDRPLSVTVQLIPAAPVTGDIDRLIQQRIQEFVDFFRQEPLAYDCYHAQDCISANALLILRQQGQIPHFIRTVHHIDAFNSPYLQACQEKSIAAPDLCLCVSAYWQAQLRQRGIDAPRVINGVDTDRFALRCRHSPEALSHSNAEAVMALKQRLSFTGHPIYLTIGGIEPRKNSIALLQAFAQVLTYRPQAQLVIAGGATLFDYQDYRDRFFTEVDRLGIGGSLVLPGVVAAADLPLLYHAADAFVFPSLKEGWGLVVMEAIASGLPVITSRQPPFTEFLSEQQALLINPQDVEAIAQAMLQVTQPALAKSLVAESQSLCDLYTWENSAKMHLNAYHQLLKDQPGTGLGRPSSPQDCLKA